MIRKPDAAWERGDDSLVENMRHFGGAASQAYSTASSGLVRIRAGYSAAVSAFMAVMSGCAALAAGLSGQNMPMAMLAGCFALALGWLSIWNFRKAIGGAQSAARPIPGWNADSIAAGGMLETGTEAGWEPRSDEPLPCGEETAICYDRSRIFLKAAQVFMACVALCAVLTRGTQKAPVFSVIVLVILGCALWHLFGLLLKGTSNDLTAISWNNRQIHVRTLTSSRQVPWSAFESAAVKQKTVRLLRLIPISKSYTLVFRLRHNGSSRTMNVLASVLTVRPAEAIDLIRKIELSRAQCTRGFASGGDRRNAGRRLAANQSLAQGFETNVSNTVAPAAFGRKIAT